ncbi:MAG: hypothetical protein H0X62_08760 [Bacteroidetes bacterium]|nr:hypothetical protein [Bacteroidota bacterium]
MKTINYFISSINNQIHFISGMPSFIYSIFLFFLLTFIGGYTLKAQVVTVLNIDTKGLMQEPVSMGNIVRIELDRLHLFEVTDKYDVYQLIGK